jgi:hypothetical protein
MSEHAGTQGIGRHDLHWPGRLERQPPLLRLAAVGAACLLVCILAVYAAIYLHNAYDSIRYPFTLDYGEGIVWQQALLIPGPRMYGPITQAPFIVFHYPPVYHLVARAVAALGFDQLAAGRAVSVACTVMAAALCAWLVGRGVGARVGRSALAVGCAIGGLLPLSLGPVDWWSTFMRVDMLALFLSFLGVALVVESVRRPVWLAVAVPLFVLAVYTKQTCIAAPAAAFAVSLTLNRRPTVMAVLGGAVLGLAALGWLEWKTDGGFLRHILGYNINPFSIRALLDQLWTQKRYAFLVIAAIGALAVLLRDRARTPAVPASPGAARARALVAILALWFVFAAAMLVTLGKSGASMNYFIEFMYVCTVPIGMVAALGWQAMVENHTGRRDTGMVLSLVCLSVGLAAQAAVKLPYRHWMLDDSVATEIQRSLVAEIARADRPVLSEDMVLLLRAGREVPIEPMIFTDLAVMGSWDQTPFLRQLISRSFAFVITMRDMRYTPQVLAAIASAYPRVERLGPYTIHRPPDR